MAISIKENYKADAATDLMADESNLRVASTAVRQFDVVFDEGATAKAAIRAVDSSTGFHIPLMYEVYPGETWLSVISRDSERVQPQKCLVTINYESYEDPLELLPEWSWNVQITDEPIDTDFSDQPVLNSSDEPWDPPITEPVYDLVLQYRRNEELYLPARAADYQDSVNGFTFLGFPPLKVKCTKYVATAARSAALIYFVVDYEFVVRVAENDTWIRKFVDEGYREKDSAGEYTPIKDKEGKDVTQPVLLDGLGQQLAAGLAAVTLEFDITKIRDLNDLNIILT